MSNCVQIYISTIVTGNVKFIAQCTGWHPHLNCNSLKSPWCVCIFVQLEVSKTIWCFRHCNDLHLPLSWQDVGLCNSLQWLYVTEDILSENRLLLELTSFTRIWMGQITSLVDSYSSQSFGYGSKKEKITGIELNSRCWKCIQINYTLFHRTIALRVKKRSPCPFILSLSHHCQYRCPALLQLVLTPWA